MLSINDLVEYSHKLRKTSLKTEKIKIIMSFLHELSIDDAEIGVNYISGKIRQGRLNFTWKNLTVLLKTKRISTKPISLMELDKCLTSAKKARGREKITVLKPLFERISVPEKKHIIGLITNELHQGAAEGLVKLSIARFFLLGDSEMEQAYLQNPDLGTLFKYLLEHGKEGVRTLSITLFRPVKPMLAEISNSIADFFNMTDEISIEEKLDGIRVQVHRDRDEIRIFSRNLKDITSHFPEIVDYVKNIPVQRFILDGEAIGVDKNGRILPFQTLGKRTMRKKNIAEMMEHIPVIPKFFDILYLDQDDLTTKAYKERQDVLNDIITDNNLLLIKTKPVKKHDIDEFFENSVKSGNEGIVAKLVDSPYRPGKRGKYWFKLKQVYTIDCVILAAEWGHGRRKGLLSNLHLGVLDETRSKYLMVGKTFKGLTDNMLAWFTENLLPLKIHEDDWTIYVKPDIVVEIAFNEVQKSSKYDSGFALRFARVRRIRHDKNPKQINTIIDLVKLKRMYG